MAIPKSTYVMGAVVLGLFGVAIQRTASKDSHHVKDEDEADSYEGDGDEELAELRASRERMQREEAEEEARQAAIEAENAKTLAAAITASRQMYGAEVATLGSAFDGVKLGKPMASVPTDRIEAYEGETTNRVTLDRHLSESLLEIRIELRPTDDTEVGDKLCENVGRMLRETWGDGVLDGPETTRIWLNPATHQRARFLLEDGDCTLAYDRYVESAGFVGRTATSVVPLQLLGQPAAKLSAMPGASVEDDAVRWTVAGLGAGTAPTSLTAYVENGKVVTIAAEVSATESVRRELEGRLASTYGKPKEIENDRGTSEHRWAGKPPISVETDFSDGDRDRLILIAGKL